MANLTNYIYQDDANLEIYREGTLVISIESESIHNTLIYSKGEDIYFKTKLLVVPNSYFDMLGGFSREVEYEIKLITKKYNLDNNAPVEHKTVLSMPYSTFIGKIDMKIETGEVFNPTLKFKTKCIHVEK